MNGAVVFVSAGPGAPDLITLRGLQALSRAEVVLADALIDAGFRALAPAAKWIEVGKRGYRASTAQDHIHALLVRHGRAGRRVVRLKGGDASVLGRLEEEMQAVQDAGLAFDVVPGVTAALAAAAHARRPLTRRGLGRSVTLATAVTADEGLGGAAAQGARADTEVFYMAGRQLAALGRRLIAGGWAPDTAVCVVSRAGHADGLVSDHRLADLARATVLHAGRPTVVTVGRGAAPVGVVRPQVADASRPEPAWPAAVA